MAKPVVMAELTKIRMQMSAIKPNGTCASLKRLVDVPAHKVVQTYDGQVSAEAHRQISVHDKMPGSTIADTVIDIGPLLCEKSKGINIAHRLRPRRYLEHNETTGVMLGKALITKWSAAVRNS